MNRALRATTVGVLLLSPLALAACSAGQVTQTATQERDKVGAMAQVGSITLRAAEFEHPRGGAYEEGDDAELRMAIVNSGQEADTLVGIEGEGFGDVEIEAETTEASASPGTVDGTAASPTTGAAAGSGTTTAPETGGGGSTELEIPADTTLFVDGDSATVTLTDLEQGLTVGQYLELTLVFENAGEITLPVTVANPDEEVERGEAFDFHHEEGGAEEGTEDTARERESRRQESGGE